MTNISIVLTSISQFLTLISFFKEGEKILEKISNIKIIAEILEQVKKLKTACDYLFIQSLHLDMNTL